MKTTFVPCVNGPAHHPLIIFVCTSNSIQTSTLEYLQPQQNVYYCVSFEAAQWMSGLKAFSPPLRQPLSQLWLQPLYALHVTLQI